MTEADPTKLARDATNEIARIVERDHFWGSAAIAIIRAAILSAERRAREAERVRCLHIFRLWDGRSERWASIPSDWESALAHIQRLVNDDGYGYDR